MEDLNNIVNPPSYGMKMCQERILIKLQKQNMEL